MKNKKSIILQIILLVVGLIFLVTSLTLKNNDDILMLYETHKKCNYEVILKPNDFYENNILQSNECYAAKSIKQLKINFEHKINSSKKANVEYKYKITNDLVATAVNRENIDKNIWNRTYFIYESDVKNGDINENIINENVEIDYDFYRNLVNSYENEYGIQINAVLKVRLDVFYNVKLENQKEKYLEDYIELDIPITNLVVEPQENYEKDSVNNIIIENDRYRIMEIICFVLGSAILVVDITIFVKQMHKFKTNLENKYTRKMKKILRNYKNYIVTINNELDFSGFKPIKVASFEDLLDVAEQNQTSILCYDAIKNKECHMYVIVRDCVYFYAFSEENI